MLRPGDAQIAPVSFIAHQRLVAPAQGLLEVGEDGFAVGPVFSGLGLVAANNITSVLAPHFLDFQRRRSGRVGLRPKYDLIPAGPSKHLPVHFLDPAHSRSENGMNPDRAGLQSRDRGRRNHSPIRHDAHARNSKPLPQPVNHREQRGDVGRVARPQFTAQRAAGPDGGPCSCRAVQCSARLFPRSIGWSCRRRPFQDR